MPPTLPTELITQILKHRHEADFWFNTKALARCCLVSHAFLPIARRFLYEELFLEPVIVAPWEEGRSDDGEPLEDQGADSEEVQEGFSPKSMKLLTTLLLYPYLSTLVKTVYVGAYYDASSSFAYSPAVLVGTVLRMCPNVDALELENEFQRDVLWETMRAIQPNLRTLRFHRECLIDLPRIGGTDD